MQSVLLVHPKIREWAIPNNVPLGTAYTAAVCRDAGLEVRVLDDNQRRLREDLLNFAPFWSALVSFELVGISAICHQYREVKRWVRALRAIRPGQPIVVGGPISVLGEKLAEWLDVSVWQGESEVEFPRAVLAGRITGRHSVHSSPRVETLDSLPFPAWDLFEIENYCNAPVGWVNKSKWSGGEAKGTPVRSMNVLASRGCPFRCNFCAHDFMGKAYRHRSPGSVIAEMVELRRRWDVRYFHLSDDNTMASASWLYRFCDAFSKHPELQGCHWGCAGRADAASRDTLTLMYSAGCRIVGMGIESGSQAALDRMNKRATAQDNERAILNSKRVFGSANYSLMVGTPGETEADIHATIEMCKRTQTRPEVVFVASPLPGSPWYDLALERGLIPDEEAYLERLDENSRTINCNISGRPDEWVLEAKRRIEEETAQFEGSI